MAANHPAASVPAKAAPIRLLSQPGSLNTPAAATAAAKASASKAGSLLAHRLSNTTQPLKQLMRSDKAILLENALVDTSLPTDLGIPAQLRAQGDPGAYIVQARTAPDDAFRAQLKQAGASIVAYIPNNAYLVRAAGAAVQQLTAQPGVQSVLPYEPYYKLKPSLLDLAVKQLPLPEGSALNLLLFPDAREATLADLNQLGVQVLAEERSPFGPVVKVQPSANGLPALAALSGVHEVEFAYTRKPANDLSRPAMGVATDSVTATNYLGLTGAGVLVNVNDSGVSMANPDLQGRVFLDPTDLLGLAGQDAAGHGTHVAGVIASSGDHSDTVTNASGSVMPPVAGQFRGKAPKASIFSLLAARSDYDLQQTAAQTNAFISNNSWNYGTTEYNLAAASYDWAVRNASPLVTGSHPMLYVFSAGNYGQINKYAGSVDDGSGGSADSILSPATAKNVITVGAVEQARYVSNYVTKCTSAADGTTDCLSNQYWMPLTDSSNQVAGYSSCGNVGIGVEGDTGRFKPDVVAPGSFVVSTRSMEWDEVNYYNPTSYIGQFYRDVIIAPNSLFLDSFDVPQIAVGATIQAWPFNGQGPQDLPIYVNSTAGATTADPVRTNIWSLPADMALPLGGTLHYGVGNNTAQYIEANVAWTVAVTNLLGDYLQVLSNVNNTLGPYYRYESGSSMAAAAVSGTLALMQEYFEQRLGQTNSPALMKALLINGARTLSDQYNFQTASAQTINYQGWGMVNLTNSLRPSMGSGVGQPSSLFAFDQSPTEALATGQSRTRFFSLTGMGQIQPLQITLAWTDPPGDPVAGIKLVNDLDLIVTNLDTGDVFYGNNIPSGQIASQPWDTNTVATPDLVNNVENVLLVPPLGANYSVTVVGHRVNVNAVTAHPNDVVQDYALVVSSGNGRYANVLSLSSDAPIVSSFTPYLTGMTNSFQNNPDQYGGILNYQHVGANSPLLGTNQLPLVNKANAVLTVGETNQWHFYVITNVNGFTNAAFLTFLPVNLSVPRMGVTADSTDNAVRPQADIDLYVSTDPNLLNLDPAAVNAAYKSLSRGGTETIIISNAVQGVYYLGVKSEDQMAAEYSILADFSRLPFSSSDAMGNQTLQAIPTPAPIPDASGDAIPKPGQVILTAICPMPIQVRRVVVTNVLSHQLMGDLVGVLTHDADSSFATLNNRSPDGAVDHKEYIYDDSGDGDITGAAHTAGPGSLHDFAGKQSGVQWRLTMTDNAPDHLGTNNNLAIWLEKQQPLTEGILLTLMPNQCKEEFIDIPANVVKMTITAGFESGTGPLSVSICRNDGSGNCKTNLITSPGGSVFIDKSDTPPLVATTYAVRFCNLGPDPLTVRVKAILEYAEVTPVASSYTSTTQVALRDDAVTYASMFVSNHMTISDMDVGLLLRDPRVSDLAVTLISPNGTRVLLVEDRGAGSTNGFGTFGNIYNAQGVAGYATTNLAPFYTNSFDDIAAGPYAPGARMGNWDVLSNIVTIFPELPAPWLSNNVLVAGQGMVSTVLPTTNSTAYTLSFNVTHAPYLVGTVGWWPLDGDAADIFGGLNGMLAGDVTFSSGMVREAFSGDGMATRMTVPACPALDVGQRQGFTVEGWINPTPVDVGTNVGPVTVTVPGNVPDPTPWVDTGLDVTAGQRLLITASGAINYDGGVTDPNGVGPANNGTVIAPGDLNSNAITVSLIGKIGGSTARGTGVAVPEGSPGKGLGFVGSSYSQIVPTSGRLYLAYNDSVFWDNSGSFTAIVRAQSSLVVTGAVVLNDGFEISSNFPSAGVGSVISGWVVESGTVDALTNGYGPGSVADSGHSYLDINGGSPGTISTNITLTPGATYCLSFAFARNPDSHTLYNFIPQAAVNLDSTRLMTIAAGNPTNSWNNLCWQSTSMVFTATSTLSKLQLQALTGFASGVLFDTFKVSQLVFPTNLAAPIVEWNANNLTDTNNATQGVQFWLGGLPGTNYTQGVLWANLWDTNSQPHLINTGTNVMAITNGGWQHVALSFDAASATARIYTNGQLAAVQQVGATNLVPRTSGDLYFGYHPGAQKSFRSFLGGLDEFGLYERALSDCEIAGIYHAGANGKYGTNALLCPVGGTIQLLTAVGTQTYTFTNGLGWATNGLTWETNFLAFTNLNFCATNGGPGTNLTPLILTSLDPNLTVDQFVLSAVVSNFNDGFLHLSENTNLALIPIKFAPAPYSVSNFPPTLIFSNSFVNVTQRVYQAGETLAGITNNPAFGPRDWTVTGGPVTVISNTMVDASGNFVVLATNGLQCLLPTAPGHRYQLGYSVRGPGAVSWWGGDINPLNRRAWDLLGGNDGAFIHSTTNSAQALVGATSLYFEAVDTNGLISKIELGDPANLALTNAFTIEGWIRPIPQTNYFGTEQLVFRGDSRDYLDPYYLALEPAVDPGQRRLHFHIEDATGYGAVDLYASNAPINVATWQHVAAVFESGVLLTNTGTFTNQLRLYVDGVLLGSTNTARAPFAVLDPAFCPGVALGNRSRYDYSQPFRGYMDELSIYGRALTDVEIGAIAAARDAGKADFTVVPARSLAKLNVLLNGVQTDTGYGDNAQWSTRSVVFTAQQTNTVLNLQGLLPGTLVDGITLTEVPPELYYQPESSLTAFNGEDAYGTWMLEFWDTRVGATNNDPALLNWQLNFTLQPIVPQPVIELVHGIPYTNTLPAYTAQNFIVRVPQWAQFATNSLLFAMDRYGVNPMAVGVLFDTNSYPTSTTNALFWPAVTNGTVVLSTNTTPGIAPGYTYYLTVTNPNPVGVTFAYVVEYDILTLTNCQPLSNFVWQAGIPRYLQFDSPSTDGPTGTPQEVTFWLTGAQSNLTVVLSQHLPLPDLTHYDYISQQPCTNDEFFVVLTNSTPFPLQTNSTRWYVGIFNSALTNVPFTAQACYATNAPAIVTLTNETAFAANFTNGFAAPPGPPRWTYYHFQITNFVDAVLFELYNLSGDADLVLQRDVVPGQAPYFAGSFNVGLSPEQIVLRTGPDLADLRGDWYLGVYNNETTDVAFTIRAAVAAGGLLQSAQPLQTRLIPMTPTPGMLIQWNAVVGEHYVVESKASLSPSVPWIPLGPVMVATTPLATYPLPPSTGAPVFYRVRHVSSSYVPQPQLYIQLSTNNMVRLYWSADFPGKTLQYTTDISGPAIWSNVNQPVTVEGKDFVVYDPIWTGPRFYRLTP